MGFVLLAPASSVDRCQTTDHQKPRAALTWLGGGCRAAGLDALPGADFSARGLCWIPRSSRNGALELQAALDARSIPVGSRAGAGRFGPMLRCARRGRRDARAGDGPGIERSENCPIGGMRDRPIDPDLIRALMVFEN